MHIYKEYHSICPFVEIGTPPPLLPQASVPLPPEPKGGGAQLPAGEGMGEYQFRRLEKKLSTLPTLCTKDSLRVPIQNSNKAPFIR
jgi:hypothetical protein